MLNQQTSKIGVLSVKFIVPKWKIIRSHAILLFYIFLNITIYMGEKYKTQSDNLKGRDHFGNLKTEDDNIKMDLKIRYDGPESSS